MNVAKARIVWDTARFLKGRQVAYQIRHRLFQRNLIRSTPSQSKFNLIELKPFPQRPASWIGGGVFRFLNQEVDLSAEIDWGAPAMPKLWQYNLHYFDFLLQPGLTFAQGEKLIQQWIIKHLPVSGSVGWEPYPISLRVTNWLKFYSLHLETPNREALDSLQLQGTNLVRQIEYHILGNHLFENAKGLCFLGEFFAEASWKNLGNKILRQQLSEQFLPDGAHFELSPMYHAIMLEGLLDVLNLWRGTNSSKIDNVRLISLKAMAWLEALLDESGGFPLLNDAAGGISPSCAELRQYVDQLGLRSAEGHRTKVQQFGHWEGRNLAGYWVTNHPRFRIWFDTAPLGPDYLLGHAHGDLLSILMDFDGRRVFEDTGVFEYEEGDRRSYSRSSAAHNTLRVDGLDQAQFWKSFRVGKRGRPFGLSINNETIACSHDGFIRQGAHIEHRRTLHLLSNGFEVSDQLLGLGQHSYEGRYHCSPGTQIVPQGNGQFLLNGKLFLDFINCVPQLETSEFYPQYGHAMLRPSFKFSKQFSNNTYSAIRCTYSS